MSEAADDAERFDLPAEITARLGKKEADFPIWPENWDILDAFLAVATQWRQIPLIDGRVHWQGLDYAAADIALARADIRLTPAQWAGLQSMERAASAALNGYRG